MRRRSSRAWGRYQASWSAVLVVVFVSASLRTWAAGAVPGPWFTPDEMIYAELGRSLWAHGRFEILGARPDFFGLVYPALVGLPLHAFGTLRGYALLKPLQGLIVSLTAIPVYCWGRSLMASRWALVAAALSLCLPGLALAGFLMTEVVFLPIFCVAAWAMARALERPSLGRQALMLGVLALAVLTRLQALVLGPAFLLAALLEATLARAWSQRLRSLAPAFVAMVFAALAWTIVAGARGGSPLGAYRVVGEAGYDAGGIARYTLYHAADLLLLTGVVPVLAVLLLAASCRRAESDPELRAYLCVTAAVTLTLLVTVGSFASRFTGRLAERNLFMLGPLFFVGFGCWLGRGAPRTRLSLAVASTVTLAILVAAPPWEILIRPAGEPDAFTLVPLVELRQRLPGVDPLFVVAAVGALAVALAAGSARRPLVAILAVGAALAGASVQVSRFAAREAGTYQHVMVGGQLGWIDAAGGGPVVFLYGGELGWSRGAPAWSNAFWNGRIAGVDELFGADVEGPVPHRATSIAPDGRVLVDGREQRQFGWAVAPNRLGLVGSPVAGSTSALTLWRIQPPLRLTTAKSGFDPANAELAGRASLTVWDCHGGAVALTLSAGSRPATIRLERDGVRFAAVRLGADGRWSGTVPLRRTASGSCVLDLVGGRGVRADRLDVLALPNDSPRSIAAAVRAP
jgi:Dolichyl-phosphate-mannose-protein mannosyltransferase